MVVGLAKLCDGEHCSSGCRSVVLMFSVRDATISMRGRQVTGMIGDAVLCLGAVAE